MTETASSDRRADVEVRVPADGAYVSVIRTTTAGLAARLDFTLDDVEDLRIAVGEACAVLLEQADDGADLEAAFWLEPGGLVVEIGAAAATPSAPDEDSFAWQVLTTLADSVAADALPGRLRVRIGHGATPLDAGA
ncbi:anti-sigma regulatory factor [Nocardioides fonticola]|uniref:Anti-sigma regulatory factor n=1 Tax=Nocardioides fonticola TaxID=450363 RepID=A0ABP7XEW9_9ACTN